MSEHELWNELGNLYFMSGAYNQAIHAYNRSIQLDGGFGRPYSNLALAYVQQGKYSEAIDLYRRSIELLIDDDEKAISWNRLGNVYRHLKDYQRAVVAYQRADELNPERRGEREEPNQLLYSAVGPASVNERRTTEESNQPQEADLITASNPDEEPTPLSDEAESASWVRADAAWYDQSASEIPENVSPPTWTELEEDSDSSLEPDEESQADFPEPGGGDLTEWLPAPEPFDGPEKQESFVERVELQSGAKKTSFVQEAKSPPYTPLLAAKINDLGSEERAKRIVSQADVDVDVEEPSPAAPFVVTVAEEEPASAQKIELEIRPAESSESDPQEMERIEAEIAKLKRVVQVNPKNGFAWDTLGTLYKSASLYKEAILAYQQAISADPSKAFYYHHLGLAYAAEGRDEDAIGAFQKVIELNPDHSLAHATLAGYFRKLGLEELAQNHIGKAMKSIYDSENEYNRACLEAIRGNADRAIDLLRLALQNRQTRVDWVLRDPDLDFIRHNPRFKQLIAEYTR